jgi:hypothetical protein
MANAAVWRKMALIRQPVGCGQGDEYEAGTWLTVVGNFAGKGPRFGGVFRDFRAGSGQVNRSPVVCLAGSNRVTCLEG